MTNFLLIFLVSLRLFFGFIMQISPITIFYSVVINRGTAPPNLIFLFIRGGWGRGALLDGNCWWYYICQNSKGILTTGVASSPNVGSWSRRNGVWVLKLGERQRASFFLRAQWANFVQFDKQWWLWLFLSNEHPPTSARLFDICRILLYDHLVSEINNQ